VGRGEGEAVDGGALEPFGGCSGVREGATDAYTEDGMSHFADLKDYLRAIQGKNMKICGYLIYTAICAP
jgi:hypothetical protein